MIDMMTPYTVVNELLYYEPFTISN